MTTETPDPTIRPEVLGHLKLAEIHRRIAGKRHLDKAQKHESRAERLAMAWAAQHPGSETPR